MSTTAVEVPQIQELPIVAEKKTYSRVSIDFGDKDKEGNPEIEYKVLSEDDAKELVKEPPTRTKKDGEKETAKVAIEETQTFAFDHAGTLDGAKELFTVVDEHGVATYNEKEHCKQTNNAIDIKLGNKVRKLMLAVGEDGNWSFEPQEGDYSLRQYIGEDTATRGKTQFEKAKTIFTKLPPDQQKQFLEMFAAMQAAQ